MLIYSVVDVTIAFLRLELELEERCARAVLCSRLAHREKHLLLGPRDFIEKA